MQISCKGWNPSKQEVRCQARCLALEYCKDPVNATDNSIDSIITALRADGCNPEVITTITIPLDEYRLLISDAQKKAKEEGCKEGREEAWDLARRIVTSHGVDIYIGIEFDSVFGSRDANTIFGIPADEALAKDKAFQEKKKTLHVGDEVEFDERLIPLNMTHRGYITRLDYQKKVVEVFTKEVGTITVNVIACKKTGNHSDEIEKLMASF